MAMPNSTDRSGAPRLLLVFAAAMLAAVAGVVLLALTGSAWALIVAVFLILVAVTGVLREVESEIDDDDRPAPASANGAAGAVAGTAPAAWSGPRRHRRLMLVVSEPIDRSDVATILQGEPRGDTAVLVVAPALQRTWLRYWVSDRDEGLDHARAVEEATLDALQREDVANAGHVGSAEPLTAIEDALRFFDADRIVIAMQFGDGHRYRERDLRAAVERRFGVPAYALDLSAGS
jgi:hypothetical protein